MENTSVSRTLRPLVAHSEEDLVADLGQVREALRSAERAEAEARAQREALAAEEQMLLQLVAWRRRLDDPDGAKRAAEHGADPALVPTQGKPRRGSKREVILRLMRERPEREGWTPREVLDGMTAVGIAATSNNVRVTLRRMREAGQLQHDADGRYSLASQQEAHDMGVG